MTRNGEARSRFGCLMRLYRMGLFSRLMKVLVDTPVYFSSTVMANVLQKSNPPKKTSKPSTTATNTYFSSSPSHTVSPSAHLPPHLPQSAPSSPYSATPPHLLPGLPPGRIPFPQNSSFHTKYISNPPNTSSHIFCKHSSNQSSPKRPVQLLSHRRRVKLPRRLLRLDILISVKMNQAINLGDRICRIRSLFWNGLWTM